MLCFFIGHRDASHEVFVPLQKAVETHIVKYGVTEFIVGHYGGFDRLAAQTTRRCAGPHPKQAMKQKL